MLTWLMLLLIVLAVFLRVKQNQAGTLACAALVVLLAFVRMTAASFSETPAERNIKKAAQVLTDGIAQKIADRHPGAKVIILGTVGTAESTGMAKGYYDTEVKLTKALEKRGLEVESMDSLPNTANDDRAAEIQKIFDELGPEDDPFLDMELEMEPGGRFDGLLELKDRADVVIMNKFMPLSVDPWDFPAAGEAPFVVLMNHPGWEDLPDVLESTVLDIVLAYRPDISKLVTKKWPKKDEEAFAQRYQLLTPENSALSR